ncbi:MAG TPA: hypothetical protein DDY31_01895 [Lachnospiraceae bacterium]|nr:hypothetical protein [Lachnospiraceae bacterium]
MENLMEKMPRMLMGRELEKAMLSLPVYEPAICKADAGTRLTALDAMTDIYVPSQMSCEIYSKVYLAMLHSLKKKHTKNAIQQGNQNHRKLQGMGYHSVLGGSDSFSIIGPSGIGKSTAIAKSIALSGGNQIIATKNPYAQIIPCINVQCPHDCSVKGLLLAILSQVDVLIGTRYEHLAVKDRASIDNLIGTVSQIALNNILLIVIDECQNICRNKGGVNLVASMTQLINSSGVSICMVGLPETELFFGKEMQLARRSVGLSYSALPYDEYFIQFCETLFSYQYVTQPSKLTPELIELLYECTGGIVAIVVSIILEAQQIAILTGKEELSKETILLAYKERLKNVQDFVKITPKKRSQTSSIVYKDIVDIPQKSSVDETDMDILVTEIIDKARAEGLDAVELLTGQEILVEEENV